MKSIAHARAALLRTDISRESTAHARAALRREHEQQEMRACRTRPPSSYLMKSTAHARAALGVYCACLSCSVLQKINVICDHGSQKGTKKFMSSKRLNFIEQRSD